jgi:hypothetical protein
VGGGRPHHQRADDGDVLPKTLTRFPEPQNSKPETYPEP